MHPIVLRTQIGIHQRPVRFGQRRGARCGHFPELFAEMLNFIRVVACDFAAEGPLDLLGRCRGLDGKELIKILHCGFYRR